ncbi:MAG: hypothetical protein ACE5GQ_10840, partial [Nitrospinales bacterium]
MSKQHVYKTPDDLSIELLKGKSETIRWTIFEDNRPVIPTSADITLRQPDQSEFPVPVAAAAMTVASGGELQYAMP